MRKQGVEARIECWPILQECVRIGPREGEVVQDSQNVPKWFADFAERNAREHAELRLEIQEGYGELKSEMHGDLKSEIAKAETRMTRWTLGAIALAVAILAAFINVNGG